MNWLQSESLDYEIIRKSIIIFVGISCLQFLESIYTSCLSGLQRQVLLNILISSFATLKGVGAVFVLTFISPTVITFFIWQLIVSIMSLLVISYSLYSTLPKSDQPTKFSFLEIQKIWRYAFGMLGITFTALMLTQLDKVILSNILLLSDFGYYSLVGAVVASLYFFVTPVTTAYFPKFVALIESNEKVPLQNAYHQSVELITVLMGVTGIFLAVNAQSILLVWTQDQEIANNTHHILSILSISTVFNGVLWIPMQMQLAHGITKISLRVNILLIFFTIPLFIILVPIYQSVTRQTSSTQVLAETFLARDSDPDSAAMMDRLATSGHPFEQVALYYQAEVAMGEGSLETALTLIEKLPDNPETLPLKRRVWIANRSFQAMAQHQKQVSKFEDDLMLSEHQALLEARWNLALDSERRDWLSVLPSISLQDDGLLLEVLLSFDDPAAAEACCRSLIERTPSLGLFLAYGDLGTQTLSIRRRHAQAWLSQFPHSANVSACLGALASAEGDPAAAIAHYLECLKLKPTPSIKRRLIGVYLMAGRFEDARALF